MSEQGPGFEEASIKTPFAEISTKGKKTSELIAILCLCLLFVAVYALWEHKTEEKSFKERLYGVLVTISKNQQITNCLMEMGTSERTGQLDRCERIVR